jgi:CRP-like cAMP-binding protein
MKAIREGGFFSTENLDICQLILHLRKAVKVYINPQNQLNKVTDKPTAKLIELLVENGTEMALKAGESAIKTGQRCDFFFMVVSGSFRAYRLLNDKEMIIGFSFAGDLDTAPHAFITDAHSTETIEAIVDSVIVKIHRNTLEHLKGIYPELKDFIENMLAHYIEVLVRRHIEFKTYTAEQLYHSLHARQPEQVKLIPLKYIASYLGISQERLSRIRAK